MLLLICLFLILPAVLGWFISFLIKPKGSDLSFFFFALGFLIMVGEFALVCYPSTFLNAPFHLVCNIVLGIYIAESIAIIIWAIKTKRFQSRHLFSKDFLATCLRSPTFWIMVAICAFQIMRLYTAQPLEMRDSKSYGALIIDILQNDQLFMNNPENGFPLESVLDMPLKFSLSPWYGFIAVLSKVGHIHPLIISNTILPAYLLVLHYAILYTLGCYLFKHEKKSAFAFTALCAFLYEVTLYCHTPTMIKLIWPVWGKGALSMTIVPIILVFYMVYVELYSEGRNIYILITLIILVIAGCSMSTMAAVELPLELGILGLVWTLRKRAARPLIYSIISCIPAGVYVVAYYCLSNL